MAITNISISQDNKVGESNLIPVHSPVIFIVDVTFTGLVPDTLKVQILDINDVLIDTYKCIPYKDLLATLRQFIFIADQPIRGLMEGFDDFAQLNETFIPVPDITLQLKLKFVDPDNASTFVVETFDFVHGAEQFGNNPNLVDQFNNENDIYFAPKDSFVYVYFYNDDAASDVNINDDVLQLIPNALEIAIGGATENIAVTSNGDWLATELESWLSLTDPAGSGNGNFGIIIDANGTGLVRNAVVTVTRGTTIKEVTISQATNVLNATYDFDLTINEDINTSINYKAWRLVDILPTSRTGNSLNVNIDYSLVATSAGRAHSYLFYGIGSDAVTEPTLWILIDSAQTAPFGGSDFQSGTGIIEIADGEFLFIKMDLQITTGIFDSNTIDLDLVDGSIVAPGTGTAIASGTPLDWDKNINGGA